VTILWFRRDLRVTDSTLLHLARGEVLPVFIFDPEILAPLPRDDKRVSFIFHALLELKKQLKKLKLDIAIFHGDVTKVFDYLKTLGAKEVVCSIDYDPYAISRDKKVELILPLKRVNDSFLFSPSEILTNNDTPYKVFTPYYNKALLRLTSKNLSTLQPSTDTFLYKNIDFERLLHIDNTIVKTEPIPSSIGFDDTLPHIPSPKESIQTFLPKLDSYHTDRDFPSLQGTSRLGLHLRFGTLGIRELLNIIYKQRDSNGKTTYIKELLWREFYASLLASFPHSAYENFYPLDIHYKNDSTIIEAFYSAKTGIPLIDAGIIELLETGYMHNRVRMIVASYLTKNLGIDWRIGERFFAKHLLDYEASSNIGSWQWCAGTGADAQPYYRRFNPLLQAKRFDPHGTYINRWLSIRK